MDQIPNGLLKFKLDLNISYGNKNNLIKYCGSENEQNSINKNKKHYLKNKSRNIDL